MKRKTYKHQVLMGMWNRNANTQLVGGAICISTLETNWKYLLKLNTHTFYDLYIPTPEYTQQGSVHVY